MPTSEITIESWQQFTALAEAEHTRAVNALGYLYRGQGNARWPLVPSLLRYQSRSPAKHIVALEQYLLREFEGRIHLAGPTNDIPGREHQLLPERWAIMQHYGAPTRLLDWTWSPYVAAYFAVEGGPNTDEVDGAIYAAHNLIFIHRPNGGEAAYPDPITPEGERELNAKLWSPAASLQHVYLASQPVLSPRLAAQQGTLVFAENVLGDHDEIMTAYARSFEDYKPLNLFEKRIIPKALKRDFLSRLRGMNIGAHTLFQGLDGLGRYMAETARLDMVDVD